MLKFWIYYLKPSQTTATSWASITGIVATTKYTMGLYSVRGFWIFTQIRQWRYSGQPHQFAAFILITTYDSHNRRYCSYGSSKVSRLKKAVQLTHSPGHWGTLSPEVWKYRSSSKGPTAAFVPLCFSSITHRGAELSKSAAAVWLVQKPAELTTDENPEV